MKSLVAQVLENSIRQALKDQHAEEIYELLKQPKYLAILKESTEVVVSSLIDSMLSVFGGAMSELPEEMTTMPDEVREAAAMAGFPFPSETSDEEFKAELMEELSTDMETMFSDPEQLKQFSYQQAEKVYMTREEYDASFEELYRTLEDNKEFGADALEGFKRATESIYESVDKQQSFVGRLVEIAQREGIETVLSEEEGILGVRDEVLFQVIKEIYPTAEDYIACQLGVFELADEYLSQVQEAMFMDGETGRMIGETLPGIQEAYKKIGDIIGEEHGKVVRQRAQEIYGG